MKKSLLILAGLTLAAANANASKARLMALGQPTDGSYYLSDTRNIFKNPAYVGALGEFATMEWGKTIDGVASPDGGSDRRSPAAEGGFTKGFGTLKAGAYLGYAGNFAANLDAFDSAANTATGAAPFTTKFLHPQNTLSLFIGGGEEMKFGAMLLYANSEDKVGGTTPTGNGDRKAKTMELRGGVSTDMFEAYAHTEFGSESKNNTAATTTAKVDSSFNWTLGGAFKVSDELKVFADLSMGEIEYKDGVATPVNGNKYKMMNWKIGAANVTDIEGGTKFFYSASLSSTSKKLEDTIANGTDTNKTDTLSIPLTVGLEHDANSWLVLRGSVAQNIPIVDSKKDRNVTDKSFDNTTTVAAGAGLKFGKLVLDGTFAGATGTTGNLNATELLGNVAMTYNF